MKNGVSVAIGRVLRAVLKATMAWHVLLGILAFFKVLRDYVGLPIAAAFIAAWRFLTVVYLSGPRDLRGLKRLLKSKSLIRKCRRNNYTVNNLFEQNAEKYPDKVCMLNSETKWTFKEILDFRNRVANCFSSHGFVPGDEVALFVESRPEYVALWLGLSKIGVICALVNTSQRHQTLIHSFSSINCKAVIFSDQLASAVREVHGAMNEKIQFFCLGNVECALGKSLDLLLQEASPLPPLDECKGNFTGKLFYVYTSGTTGLPKAAIIRNSRYIWMGSAIHNMLKIRDDDVVYTCMPMYHTASGILAVCQCLVFANTLAIRAKFSASRFWDDCINFNVTVTHYIGEICRYLLAQNPKETDTQHKVRLMFGNGLRPQIWQQFTDRFNIKEIGELYGSTEGNANVINFDNKVGAVGFISQICSTVYPVSLIKMNPETGEPIRGKNGLCVVCKPGEPGEFVGKILHHDPIRAFDGYVNKSATQKKIVQNVFRTGDMAFLSGDLLVMDKLGYLFFMDRTGDTFRWKGENVSTMEVEGIISRVLGHIDCVVYGVLVGDLEGKAGMIALAARHETFDCKRFTSCMKQSLPAYAVPVFLRFVKELEATGTFKLKKVDLQKEGANPEKISDPLYYLDSRAATFLPLDMNAFNSIVAGKISL